MAERFRCAWCAEFGLHGGYPLRACDEHYVEIEALQRDARRMLTSTRLRLRITPGGEEAMRVRAEGDARFVRGEVAEDGWVALA